MRRLAVARDGRVTGRPLARRTQCRERRWAGGRHGPRFTLDDPDRTFVHGSGDVEEPVSGPLSPPELTERDVTALPPYVSNGVIGLRYPGLPHLPGTTMVNGFAGRQSRTTGSRASLAPRSRSRPTSSSTASGHRRRPNGPGSSGNATTSRRASCRRSGTSGSTARSPRSTPWCSAHDRSLRSPRARSLSGSTGAADIGDRRRHRSRRRPGSGRRARPAPGPGTERGGRRPAPLAPAGRDLDARHGLRDVVPWGRRRERGDCDAGRARLVLDDISAARAEPTGLPRDPHLGIGAQPVARPARRTGRSPCGACRAVADSTGCGTRTASIWNDLWKGRITIDGADARWQAITDASTYYLLSSVHSSSLASTSLFGLAYWPNYHYYHGHVMWDIETFTLPPLLLLAPDAARALLDYPHRHLEAARHNAVAPWLARCDVPVGELPGPRRRGDARGAGRTRRITSASTSPLPSPRMSTRPATWTTPDGSAGRCCDPLRSSRRLGSIRTAPRLRDRATPSGRVSNTSRSPTTPSPTWRRPRCCGTRPRSRAAIGECATARSGRTIADGLVAAAGYASGRDHQP